MPPRRRKSVVAQDAQAKTTSSVASKTTSVSSNVVASLEKQEKPKIPFAVDKQIVDEKLELFKAHEKRELATKQKKFQEEKQEVLRKLKELAPSMKEREGKSGTGFTKEEAMYLNRFGV